MNAIDLEVIYQSTLQIARELTLNMLRTGYSTIIKESQDFTFAIFDGASRMVAQGIPQPLHIGPLTAQVNEIRRRFRDATEPGDAFIVNHPYQACQNHATDVTVILRSPRGESQRVWRDRCERGPRRMIGQALGRRPSRLALLAPQGDGEQHHHFTGYVFSSCAK